MFCKSNISKAYSKLQSVLAVVFLLLLPTQFGYHYFAKFSYVQAIKVDYLSLQLYLQDCVGLLLCILWLAKNKISKKLLLIFLLLALYITTSLNAAITTNYLLRLLVTFVTCIIIAKQNLVKQKYLIIVIFAICAVELLLCVAQLSAQSSIGGFWYFLGERNIKSYMPQVAKVAISGVQILRPYGTFSHPNTLAGFFLILNTFITCNLLNFKKIKLYQPSLTPSTTNSEWVFDILVALSYFMSAGIIFISFAKFVIIVFLVTQTYLVFKNKNIQVCKLCVFVRPVIFFSCAIFFLNSSGDSLSLQKRLFLNSQALQLFLIYPIFGVGFGNYVLGASQVGGMFAGTTLNQPVHNVFLLFICEFGLFGVATIYFLIKNNLSFVKRFCTQNAAFLLVILSLGIFDHYLLTQVQTTCLTIFLSIILFYKSTVPAKQI